MRWQAAVCCGLQTPDATRVHSAQSAGTAAVRRYQCVSCPAVRGVMDDICRPEMHPLMDAPINGCGDSYQMQRWPPPCMSVQHVTARAGEGKLFSFDGSFIPSAAAPASHCQSGGTCNSLLHSYAWPAAGSRQPCTRGNPLVAPQHVCLLPAIGHL